MNAPSLEIAGIRIDEFSTTLTDILVALFCFYAAYVLQAYRKKHKSGSLLIWHFVFLGLGTFLGGVMGHGFLYALGMTGKLPGWLFSMISVLCLEGFVLEQLHRQVRPVWFNTFFSLILINFIVFALLAVSGLSFIWVEVHTVAGLLLFVGGAGLWMIRKGRMKKMFIRFWQGIAAAFLAALVFVLKISLHRWFNHLDISHVFLGISAWYFYRGAHDWFAGLDLEKHPEVAERMA